VQKKNKIKEKELKEKTLKETIKTIENLAKKIFVKKNDNYFKTLKAGEPKNQNKRKGGILMARKKYYLFVGLAILIIFFLIYWFKADLKEFVLIDISKLSSEKVEMINKGIPDKVSIIEIPKKEFFSQKYALVLIALRSKSANNFEVIFSGKNKENNLWYQAKERMPLRNFQGVVQGEIKDRILVVYLNKSFIPLMVLLIAMTGITLISFIFS
jgi:hypothetical protein